MAAASEVWKPYEPSTRSPWNRRRAVHLHRRAAFGATWSELERDLAGSPQDAVSRLLAGEARLDGVPADFASTAAMLTDAAAGSQLDRRLKAAWVYRMLFSPDPLRERLTLLWHDHFATSNLKVENLKAMRQQNDLLREHAEGKFAELLTAAVHSPAMLVWLDADKNVPAHPNENLGRELMELFTLGVGNYSEADVKDAARALTGWRVSTDEFRFNRERHDDGEKTILGQTAKFDGDGLLTLLVSQPATARRVADRICQLLLAESLITAEAIESLAELLRSQELHIAAAVERVLRSETFFAAENVAATVAAPPQFVVSALRSLECFNPPPSTLLLADWMARMGQDLYYPPNVGGWPRGKAWLTSSAIVARANFAAALVAGRLTQAASPPNIEELIERRRGASTMQESIQWLGELLYGGLPQDVTLAIEQQAVPDKARSPLSAAVLMLLSRPEAHLA
jgi:uncharacterized protein (DUF1800 family)